jgi:hypothetical protein
MKANQKEVSVLSPVSNRITHKETRDPPGEARVGEPTHLHRRGTYPSAAVILGAMRRFVHLAGSDCTTILNNQLGRLWKEEVVAGFKALFRDGNHEICSLSQQVPRPRFELFISQI